MRWVFALTACASIAAVILICVFLFANGVDVYKRQGLDSALFCLLAMAASILLVYLATRKLLPRKKAG